MGIRSELRYDGDACQVCNAALDSSTSLTLRAGVMFSGSSFWEFPNESVTALIAVCPSCKIRNVIPWEV